MSVSPAKVLFSLNYRNNRDDEALLCLLLWMFSVSWMVSEIPHAKFYVLLVQPQGRGPPE